MSEVKDAGQSSVESSAVSEVDKYHPAGTRQVAKTEAGPLYRIPIGSKEKIPVAANLPPSLKKTIISPRERRRLQIKLTWNSRKGFRGVGKPNSAFVASNGPELFVDHLLEQPDFPRPDITKLHDFMTEAVDYRKSRVCLSGHIAPLEQPTNNINYIILLDRFAGEKSYEKMDPSCQTVMHQLYGAKIFPFTADGCPIAAQ
jgi:hypothetical protein